MPAPPAPRFDPETPPPPNRQIILAKLLDECIGRLNGLPEGRELPRQTARSLVRRITGRKHETLCLRGRWYVSRNLATGAMTLAIADPGIDNGRIEITDEPGPWWDLMRAGWRTRLLAEVAVAVAEVRRGSPSDSGASGARKRARLDEARKQIAGQDGD